MIQEGVSALALGFVGLAVAAGLANFSAVSPQGMKLKDRYST